MSSIPDGRSSPGGPSSPLCPFTEANSLRSWINCSPVRRSLGKLFCICSLNLKEYNKTHALPMKHSFRSHVNSYYTFFKSKELWFKERNQNSIPFLFPFYSKNLPCDKTVYRYLHFLPVFVMQWRRHGQA